MTEIAKTVVFVVVGVAALGLALLVDLANRPSESAVGGPIAVGEPLFEDFDALEVTELEIVEWNEETGTPRFFKVAQVNNVWSIPSHSNYPADAKDQLSKAAPSVMGLNVVKFESDSPGDFSEYGVVDPASENLEPGTTGVGTRVVMKNKEGKELVALVIGKEVPDRSDLHFVRRVGEDPIYTVKIDPSKLSTKFQDWIEKDLLKLNTWDIKQIRVRDYSIDELAGRVRARSQFAVEYNDTGDTRWKLLESKTLNPETGEWTDRTLSDQEELNTEKLNDMKYALDDLEIVDVARKPEGLSANLRATGTIVPDDEAWLSLRQKGFYLVPVSGQLRSNEGEALVLMKDGVQYTLRFGEIVEDTSGGEKEKDQEATGEEKTEEEKDKAEKADSDLNRYIFVMAEFNPDLIPKPELEPLPELPEGADDAAGQKPDDQQPGDEKPDDKKPAGEDADEGKEPKPDAPAETPGAPGEAGTAGEPGQEPAGEPADSAEQPPAAPAETPAAPAETPGDTPAEAGQPAEPTEGPAAGGETAQPAPEGEKPAETSKPEDEKDKLEEIKKERERIEKENQRKQDEYEKKLEDGKKKVDELNARFADWYYVISNEVYKKIHLSFDQIVKEKEKKDEDKDGDDAGEKTGDAAPDAGEADHDRGDDTPGDQPSTEEKPESVLDELDGLEKEGPGGAKD